MKETKMKPLKLRNFKCTALEENVFFSVDNVAYERYAPSQLNSVVMMPAQSLSQSIKTACFTVSLAALRSKGIKAEL